MADVATRQRSDRKQQVGEAFRANQQDLLNYFTRRVNPDDAADLIGDTAVVVARRWRDVPADPEQARMWLFTTARHVLNNHKRSARRRDDLAVRLSQELRIAQNAEPDTNAQWDVRDALDAIAPDAAELLRLIHWDGFTSKDAALILGVPASAVRSRHATAKQLLRDALADIPE